MNNTSPRWEYWPAERFITLESAVLLSMNIDPDIFLVEPLLQNRIHSVTLNKDIWKEFNSRHSLLQECKHRITHITVFEFAEWAISTKLDIPEELKLIAKSTMDTAISTNNAWPWGEHETKLLRDLAAAGKRFWKNYDKEDKTTAPKNSDVVDYLKTRGVADRNAKVIATILRADGLPTGPRK